jgi:hypothetical protein
MKPEKINSKEIFAKSYKFLVPIYQRNYAWGEKEISTLIDDINGINKEDDEYFLGSVVYYKRSDGTLEVIDGQQRLTSLYLLFAYLHNTGIDASFVLPSDCLTYESRPGYKNALQSLNDEEKLHYDEGSQSILDGYQYIKQTFGAEIKKQNLTNFVSKLGKVVVFMIEVPQDTDLNHYFEIMNTRGDQLEQHEVLKNRMYSAEGLTDEEKTLFAKIWDSCSNMGKYIQKSFTFNNPEKRTEIFGACWDTFVPNNFTELLSFFNDKKQRDDKISIFDSISDDEFGKASEDIEKEKNNDESVDDFNQLITFPALLLHCKNIVDEKKATEGYLDDGKLLNCFPKKPEKGFVKQFAYSLLKAKFLLDNYIIHRETDAQAEDEFVLQRGHKTGYEKLTPKNAFSIGIEEDVAVEDDKTKKVIMIQSCLRVSYTSPKQMYWITKLLEVLFYGIDVDKIIEVCEKILKDEVKKYITGDNFIRAYQKLPRYVYFYLDYLLWKNGYNHNGINIDDNGYRGRFKFLFRSPIDHFMPLEDGDSYSFDDTPEDSKWKHSFGNLSCITTHLNFTIKSNRDIIFSFEQLLQSPKLYIMSKTRDNMRKQNREYDASATEEHCKEMEQILEDEIKCYFCMFQSTRP